MTSYTLFAQGGADGVQSPTTVYRSWGNVFTVSESVSLTGIWVYSGPTAGALPSECGVYIVGNAVAVADDASPSWSGAAGSGWVKCTFDGSVTLEPETEYIAAAAGAGTWLFDDAGFWSDGITNGPLSAPSDSASPIGQGAFTTGGPPMELPATSSDGINPWVDVEVTASGGTDVTAQLASSLAPMALAAGGTETIGGQLATGLAPMALAAGGVVKQDVSGELAASLAPMAVALRSRRRGSSNLFLLTGGL